MPASSTSRRSRFCGCCSRAASPAPPGQEPAPPAAAARHDEKQEADTSNLRWFDALEPGLDDVDDADAGFAAENVRDASGSPRHQEQDEGAASAGSIDGDVTTIESLLRTLRLPEAHTLATNFLRKYRNSSSHSSAVKAAARSALQQRVGPLLDSLPFSIDKLSQCVRLLFNEKISEPEKDNHLAFEYEYENAVFDFRLNFYPNENGKGEFMRNYFDCGVVPIDLFHVCAFFAEIDLAASWVPFLKKSEILHEFAGPADMLWHSRAKVPIPGHAGFECYHQRFCADMFSPSAPPSPPSSGAPSVRLPDGINGLLVAEFSPPEKVNSISKSEAGAAGAERTFWRNAVAIPPPATGWLSPTRIQARMLANLVYPVRVVAKDTPAEGVEGLVVKVAVEADFGLPRWMIPNSLIRSLVRMIVRLLLGRVQAQSTKFASGPYMERVSGDRKALYDVIRKRVRDHTVVIEDREKTYLEVSRKVVAERKKLAEKWKGFSCAGPSSRAAAAEGSRRRSRVDSDSQSSASRRENVDEDGSSGGTRGAGGDSRAASSKSKPKFSVESIGSVGTESITVEIEDNSLEPQRRDEADVPIRTTVAAGG